MRKWHETMAAQIGLRAAGAMLLLGAWLACNGLYTRVHAHLPGEATPAELAVCAAVLILALAGNLLLFVGPALWKIVEKPHPWPARWPDADGLE